MCWSIMVLGLFFATVHVEAAGADELSEDTFLSSVRQVTFEGRRAGEGYFSADGKQLVFQSERDPANPFFQIYLMDLETGDTRLVSPGLGKTTCSWIHPHGERVLFASTHADPNAPNKQREELEFRASGQERRYSWDYDEHYELYEVDLTSGETRRLTQALGYDAEASWSPDGSLIVFSSNRQAYERDLTEREKQIFQDDKSYFVDLYRMNADGGGVRRLTTTPGYDGGPFFSQDGQKICWRRFSEDGATAEIYIMDVDGVNPRQLTQLGAMSWAPFFHPSGDYLIFATNLHGFANFELYLVDVEGRSEPVRVTFTDGFDGLPSFSPDGKTLSWTSNRTSAGQSQIFFADWNDQAARQVLGLTEEWLPTRFEISSTDLYHHVSRLASEEMEGRLTGSPGAYSATRYGAEVFKRLGLEPAGDEGSYFQEFEFTAGVALGRGNRLAVLRDGEEELLEVDRDWRPLAYSKTGQLESAPLVFAGYGLVAPEEDDFPDYDSYVHLDVEDKWALVFRYLPEDVTPERRQHLSRYSGLRYKAMTAREKGAVGLVVVSGPSSGVENELVDLSFDASLAATSLMIISISDASAQVLLDAADRDLKELQKELDSGQPSMGFALPGVELSATIDIEHEKKRGRNVLAVLSSATPDSEPAVVVGAHIDHLGRGRGMSTLARDEEKGQIHYGADDNASGVAGLLEMAEFLSDQKKKGKLPLRRDVIFALWSGEELGLLGSSHFVSELSKRAGNESDISSLVAAYLNMDMIGRLQEKLILQGVGSSSVWPSEIERRNVAIGLAITTQNDSYLPTDTTPFYLKRVPVLSAFTGTHAEYHSPRDRVGTLDFEGMVKVSRLITSICRSLSLTSEEPDYKAMKRPVEGGGRAKLRAYLGTIPDYAQGDVVGVKLSGVIGGGPAERAGLKAGDIIVELAGRNIENIYDYTYAIEALKIGQTVTIVVIRGEESIPMEITPGSRE